MKAVLISIQPKWCEKIASGEKTLEVRKTRPKLETPFKCYIYETKGKIKYYSQPMPIPYYEGEGRVIGEFVCDKVTPFDVPYPAFQKKLDKTIMEQSCLTYYQLHRYAYHDCLYGWHISDLKIYDEPKELREFRQCHKCEYMGVCNDTCWNPLKRPPQSWCYVEGCE